MLGAESDAVTDTGGIDIVTSTITRSLAGYASVENLTLLGSGNLGGTGNGLANTITGTSGDNGLTGGAGIDTLIGGLGGDTYYLGADADLITDSGGYDTISASVSRSLAGYATVERLVLEGSADLGGVGNGLANQLFGNAGRNNLQGGAGNDIVVGGMGRDAMRGDAGNDTFDFNAAAETGIDANTRDIVADFAQGADRIDLSTIDANGALPGNAFAFVGAAAFTGTAGQLRFFQIDDADNALDLTVVEADIDGNGAADFQIGLTGLVDLAAGDFVV